MAGSVLRESGEALGAGFDSAPSLGLFFQHVSFQREKFMSGQVILYFEDQADALRFALAAGSVVAGDGARVTADLIHETTRGSRILLDAANVWNIKKPTLEGVAEPPSKCPVNKTLSQSPC